MEANAVYTDTQLCTAYTTQSERETYSQIGRERKQKKEKLDLDSITDLWHQINYRWQIQIVYG